MRCTRFGDSFGHQFWGLRNGTGNCPRIPPASPQPHPPPRPPKRRNNRRRPRITRIIPHRMKVRRQPQNPVPQRLRQALPVRRNPRDKGHINPPRRARRRHPHPSVAIAVNINRISRRGQRKARTFGRQSSHRRNRLNRRRTQALPGGIEVCFANSSRHISAHDRRRFFDRFYRGDVAHNRNIDGSGLGLSLAREIARAHGGDLTLLASSQDVVVIGLSLPRTIRSSSAAKEKPSSSPS